ncbi:MAG TPA: hypothetical protein VHN73_05430 [Phenylobacterium sp.]|nr:hypothetical protein [Phenylobacterium sp.]
MKVALAMILALGLCACATGGPDGGVASYDVLKAAQDNCAARGGRLVLKDQGDNRNIEAYACKGT